MKEIIAPTITSSSFSVLQRLYDKGQKHIMEWSIQLTAETVQVRYKPTIYVYPRPDLKVYQSVYNCLQELQCPESILALQQTTHKTAMYQGLRIPEESHIPKCLFIHEIEQNFIHAYRWQTKTSYDQCYYHYQNTGKIAANTTRIHKTLQPFLKAITTGEEFYKFYGIWTQEFEGQKKEVYLSFPSRPQFKWVLQAIQPLVCKTVYEQLKTFAQLPFKNIGFDTVAHQENPVMTIYFTYILDKTFPANYKEMQQLSYGTIEVI